MKPTAFTVFLFISGLAFAALSLRFALLPTSMETTFLNIKSRVDINQNAGTASVGMGIISAAGFITFGLIYRRKSVQ